MRVALEPGCPLLGIFRARESLTVVFRGLGDAHPHACWDGWIYLTYTALDERVGEEVERLEIVPCRRFAEGAAAFTPRPER